MGTGASVDEQGADQHCPIGVAQMITSHGVIGAWLMWAEASMMASARTHSAG